MREHPLQYPPASDKELFYFADEFSAVERSRFSFAEKGARVHRPLFFGIDEHDVGVETGSKQAFVETEDTRGICRRALYRIA